MYWPTLDLSIRSLANSVIFSVIQYIFRTGLCDSVHVLCIVEFIGPYITGVCARVWVYTHRCGTKGIQWLYLNRCLSLQSESEVSVLQSQSDGAWGWPSLFCWEHWQRPLHNTNTTPNHYSNSPYSKTHRVFLTLASAQHPNIWLTGTMTSWGKSEWNCSYGAESLFNIIMKSTTIWGDVKVEEFLNLRFRDPLLGQAIPPGGPGIRSTFF